MGRAAENIGLKIRTQRKKEGLTIKELATLSKTTSDYVWRLENNRSTQRTAARIKHIADALNLSLDTLFEPALSHAERYELRLLGQYYLKLSAINREHVMQIAQIWSSNDCY